MNIFNPDIYNNPLITKSDVEKAVIDICKPLKKFYSHGCAQLHVGNTGTVYSEQCARMEGFARPLWALAPLWAGGGKSDFEEIYLTGIKNGTNPEHEEYWGNIGDFDQRMVEMAALSLAIAISPEKVWDSLNKEEKNNFAAWLESINHFIVSDNNWLFFQVLVNVALKKVGEAYSQEGLDKALKRIDDFYLSEGWYSDGETEQRDYYIPFAMHYYGLIYSKLMEKEDPDRSKLYKERASIFAKDFIYWFAEDGSALPYGRSLTYRFAQCAFWSAMAFAEVETFSYGVIKGIILRNLRWWFKQPIFSTDGILTVGYAYPNLIMAEGYNAPGSPYWALKAFLPLALKENHPFWRADEEQLPTLDKISVQKHPHMIICNDKDTSHILSFTSGQAAWHVHSAAKYEKFVYSNVFGFSVPKGEYGLSEGAYDSMLALSEGDQMYRVRRSCDEYSIEHNVIYSKWKPWFDVEVKTWLIPGNPWHVRIHKIYTERYLDAAEGGFAIKRDYNFRQLPKETINIEENKMSVTFPWGTSGIVNLYGNRKSELIWPEANTNLINPRTIIPTLKGSLVPGVNLLITAVLGDVVSNADESEWNNCPQVYVNEGVFSVIYKNETICELSILENKQNV